MLYVTQADMEKDNFFTPAKFEQKLFYPRKCVTCDKREFATKQHKMCLTTSISKIRLPNIYRSNNYITINKKNPLFIAIFKNLPNKNPKVLPQKAQNCDVTHFCNKTE